MKAKEHGFSHVLYIYLGQEEFDPYEEFCEAFFSIRMWEYITESDPIFGSDNGTWEIGPYAAKDLIKIAEEDLLDETKKITKECLNKVLAYYRKKNREGIIIYTNEF